MEHSSSHNASQRNSSSLLHNKTMSSQHSKSQGRSY